MIQERISPEKKEFFGLRKAFAINTMEEDLETIVIKKLGFGDVDHEKLTF